MTTAEYYTRFEEHLSASNEMAKPVEIRIMHMQLAGMYLMLCLRGPE